LDRLLSKAGGASYCALLGDYYRKGDVIPKDPTKALANYDRACARDLLDACWKKAEMIARGEGVAADPVQAKKFLRKSCPEGWAWGNVNGCAFMGAAYESGSFGFLRDPVHALEIYEDHCASEGNPMCTKAAAMYEKGAVVKRDLDKANALYKRGCGSTGWGDAAACAKAAPIVAKTDPKLGLAMYRHACLEGKDLKSCMAAGDLVAKNQDAPSAKAFYRSACTLTLLAPVCAKSTALGNPAPTKPH
jgi:TPR repeat protein